MIMANKSAINIVSASPFTFCKLSGMFKGYIKACINTILGEKENATTQTCRPPSMAATHQVGICRPLCTANRSLSSFNILLCIDTNPTDNSPQHQPYWRLASEYLEIADQIAKLLANRCFTERHSQFIAPVIIIAQLDGSDLRISINYRGSSSIAI